MLTSWMLLSDEDMFSCVVEIAVGLYWRRFWTAPRVAASDEMLLIAALIALTAPAWLRSNTLPPPEALLQVKPLTPRFDELSMSWKETVRVSLDDGPTCNVTAPL